MIAWHNKYDDLPTCVNGQFDPQIAAGYAASYLLLKHTRVEMRIDGHWHRPPVGMQAGQASHLWRLPENTGYGASTDFWYRRAMTLEPLP